MKREINKLIYLLLSINNLITLSTHYLEVGYICLGAECVIPDCLQCLIVEGETICKLCAPMYYMEVESASAPPNKSSCNSCVNNTQNTENIILHRKEDVVCLLNSLSMNNTLNYIYYFIYLECPINYALNQTTNECHIVTESSQSKEKEESNLPHIFKWIGISIIIALAIILPISIYLCKRTRIYWNSSVMRGVLVLIGSFCYHLVINYIMYNIYIYIYIIEHRGDVCLGSYFNLCGFVFQTI